MKDFENIYNEATAEIADGKVYVKQYNAGNAFLGYQDGGRGNTSRDEWVPLQKADRVPPSAKSAIMKAARTLSSDEVQQLNKFDPEPTPDITMNGAKVNINFPNGKVKSMYVKEGYSKEKAYRMTEAIFNNESKLLDMCKMAVMDAYSIKELQDMDYIDAYEVVFSFVSDILSEFEEDINEKSVEFTEILLMGFGIEE